MQAATGANAQKFQSTPPVKAATVRHQPFAKFLGFQSTPPVKAATCNWRLAIRRAAISIHAAREGGDCAFPCSLRQGIFISIHAAREGGDAEILVKIKHVHISIHAAREGGDASQSAGYQSPPYFNPRRP